MSYQSISVLRQQLLPSMRVHGIIVKGGDAPNIIPDYTKSEYYLRASTKKQVFIIYLVKYSATKSIQLF